MIVTPTGYKFRLHPEGHKIRQAAQLSFKFFWVAPWFCFSCYQTGGIILQEALVND